MDGTASPSLFEHAAHFEAELTDRQREVLRLIARGKTNPEIAEVLGMTLAGAKWHVSELLSKLGLDSREAAAEFYSWNKSPRRRVARSLRAVTGISLSKLGLGAATTVLVVGAGTALFLATSDDPPDLGPAEPGLPFYMEATFTRTEQHFSTAAARRYWYEDSSHQRIERDTPTFTRSDPGFKIEFGPPETRASLLDGDRIWRQFGSTYRGDPIDTLPVPARYLDGTELGPIPYATFDQYADSMRNGTNELSVKDAHLFGQRVKLITSTSRDDSGQPVFSERRWVDPTRMFVFKTVMEFGKSSERVVVTETMKLIRYGEHQPAGQFVWTPPPDTTQDQCSNDPVLLGADGSLPPPFLKLPLEELPANLELSSWGPDARDVGACVLTGLEVEFRNRVDGIPRLSFHELQATPEAVFGSWTTVDVDLGFRVAGKLGDADGGGRSLAFQTSNIGVELRSPSLSDDELVRIAQAMVAAAN